MKAKAVAIALACAVVLPKAQAIPVSGSDAGRDAAEAGRIVLVANAAETDSIALAGHYARARGVPVENIIALPMPVEETITWRAFVDAIHNPLQEELVKGGWIDAAPPTLADAIGRNRIAPLSHRISYLVLLRGVPLRIAHDHERVDKEAARIPERLRTSQASVDGELALLASAPGTVSGPAPNPLFRVKEPGAIALSSVVRVARIDGPSPGDCIQMIDTAIAVERAGLAGRAYVDAGGPHAAGDRWLGAVAETARAMDFDVDAHAARGVMESWMRCDAPALYFGWHARDLAGPFRLPGFRFAPGAIAMHIHSFSARAVRSDSAGWCGPLVARGAAATVGNVFEPYLEFSHRPDLLIEALAQGRTWGEAGYYALPALSWQAVLIGDPLYRPFAVSLDGQLERIESIEPALRPHVWIREYNRRARTGSQADAARWLAGVGVGERGHAPVLALRLFDHLRENGPPGAARPMLEDFLLDRPWKPQEFALVLAAADCFTALGDHREALSLFDRLLSMPEFDDSWKRHALPRGIASATAAGDAARQTAWSEQLRQLTDAGR